MNSLVADYGTSSGESDTDSSVTPDDSETDIRNEKEEEQVFAKLPKPDFHTASSENSVFKNPFAEAENAKKAILEKHVKMVPTKDKVQMINGKKICWNYRKGRCRFGHNCTFAHDTDLHKIKDEDKTANLRQSSVSQDNTEHPPDTNNQEQHMQVGSKRKRPGLGNNIVPSKKVMKMYKQNKSKNSK